MPWRSRLRYRATPSPCDSETPAVTFSAMGRRAGSDVTIGSAISCRSIEQSAARCIVSDNLKAAMKPRKCLTSVLLLAFVAAVTTATGQTTREQTATGERGMVVTGHPIATDTGAKVLQD